MWGIWRWRGRRGCSRLLYWCMLLGLRCSDVISYAKSTTPASHGCNTPTRTSTHLSPIWSPPPSPSSSNGSSSNPLSTSTTSTSLTTLSLTTPFPSSLTLLSVHQLSVWLLFPISTILYRKRFGVIWIWFMSRRGIWVGRCGRRLLRMIGRLCWGRGRWGGWIRSIGRSISIRCPIGLFLGLVCMSRMIINLLSKPLTP